MRHLLPPAHGAAPLAYSRAEAAALVDLSVPRIDKEIRSGRLTAKQIGGRIVVPAKALEEWLDAQPDV